MAYIHNQVYGTFSTINAVAWSLEVEVQFYILAPLVCTLFRFGKLWRRALFALTALAAIAVQYYWPTERIQTSILGQAQYFLIGIALADVFISDWEGRPVMHIGWDAVSVVAWLVLALSLAHERMRMVLAPLMVLAAYVAAFRGPFTNAVLRNAVLSTIGGMCYTIYLYHTFIISGLGRITVPLLGYSVLVQTVTMGLAAVLPCGIMFVLAERPFMQRDWPSKLRVSCAGFWR